MAGYTIESKPASKNGWFTPSEAKSYYGRYARTGYCVHWWGDGTGASNHDNIVNYINAGSAKGQKSVNYVLSDNKITNCVAPDNVAWCQQSGNATEISVEHQPTLHAEGYKKSGWLKNELDKRYKRKLVIHPHKFWFATACPGTISLDRIAQEADKWARGVYNPAPLPTPTPVPPPPKPTEPVVTKITAVSKYTLANAKLVDIKTLKVIKTFPLDTKIEIGGKTTYNGKNFLLSVYSVSTNVLNGFLEGDLKALPGNPTPPQTPPPTPVPPTAPDWVANLRDINNTEFWFTKDTDLIDITTGKPTGTKTFKKDESFVASALTKAGNIEYRITEYSFSKKIYNGVPIGNLTLTKPGVPNIPPVPSTPTIEDNVNWLVKAVKAILAFFKINV